MKLSFLIFLLIFCLWNGTQAAAKKSKAKRATVPYMVITKTVVSIRPILKDIYGLLHVMLRNPDIEIKDAVMRSRDHEVIGQLITINSKLSVMEETVASLTDTAIIIENLLQSFPSILKLQLRMEELTRILSQIKFMNNQLRAYLIYNYKNTSQEMNTLNAFKPFIEPPKTADIEENTVRILKRDSKSEPLVEEYTLVDLASWVAGHSSDSAQALLNRIHDLVVSDEISGSGIFDVIEDITKESDSNLCNLRQSPQQTLYNLYNTISIADLKAYTLLQFSYMILKMYGKGNFTAESDIAKTNYEDRVKQKMEVAKTALSKAERSLYRCDPKQYVEGVTHTKLTRLLQGYIENEVNLNPYGTCRENCQYYNFAEYNGCFKNQFCAKQPQCNGKVLECRYVDSDMDICTSSNPERRYDWVEYENGRVLGSKGTCQKKNLFKVDSWWRYLFWHCSYCLCLCDDNNDQSDRYFNLRDVTSDIEDNKVVTGVRMVKNNQIIHIQIQQGVLGPRGTVNKGSLSWKPVENYTIHDFNIQSNIDYFTMNWLERAIDTDEVIAPSEHVVTGLRFRRIGTHLNLEVRATPINFVTGEVYKAENSYWLGNDNTEGSFTPRTEILLKNPDIPNRNGPHKLNSKHDQYIQFQPTSFDTDASQTTVPFIDSQVITSQGFPLSGIGLIHRGKPGSGGFIAPKLISYDFIPHLDLFTS